MDSAEIALTTTPQDLLPLPSDGTLIPSDRLPAYIGLARQTLARWRHEGKGPKFIKLGGKVLYRASDVRDWVDAQARSHTA